MFDQSYTHGVYGWFRDGRSEKEILQFNKWEKNKRLANTVSRIPHEIKYVTKYIIEDDEIAA